MPGGLLKSSCWKPGWHIQGQALRGLHGFAVDVVEFKMDVLQAIFFTHRTWLTWLGSQQQPTLCHLLKSIGLPSRKNSWLLHGYMGIIIAHTGNSFWPISIKNQDRAIFDGSYWLMAQGAWFTPASPRCWIIIPIIIPIIIIIIIILIQPRKVTEKWTYSCQCAEVCFTAVLPLAQSWPALCSYGSIRKVTRFPAMHRDELDHIRSCPCHRSPAAHQLYSNGRFQVPSIGGAPCPWKGKRFKLPKKTCRNFIQPVRHQTIQHYLDTTSSTLDKSLKTATRLRVQLQMVQTLM